MERQEGSAVPALRPHDVYGVGSQTPSLTVENVESFLTFTLAMGRPAQAQVLCDQV